MKYLPVLLLLLLSRPQKNFAQKTDTCIKKATINISKPPEKTEGFVTDQRLDAFDNNFLENLYDNRFRFSNDYSGSLKSPGSLFSELDFSSYELLTTNLTFSDKNSVQKLSFAPFRLSNKTRSNLLLNSKLNIAVKGGITTFGAAIGGDYSDQRLTRIEKMRDAIFKMGIYDIPVCGSKQDQEAAKLKNIKEAKRLLNKYDSARTKSVFKWSAGYSVQLFALLSTTGDNVVADSVNYYGMKANVISLSCSYGINNGQWQFSGGYNNISSRKNAEKGQNKILYHSWQIAASYRMLSFLKGDKLKSNDNYIKALFVPSLNIGFSYDYKNTNGAVKFIEEGIQKSRVITPYIDILLTPASGFKIGFPFTKNKSVIDAKTLQLGAVIQYSFKLINLN